MAKSMAIAVPPVTAYFKKRFQGRFWIEEESAFMLFRNDFWQLVEMVVLVFDNMLKRVGKISVGQE